MTTLPVVYLAAGEGKRLRPLTTDRPKAMIDLDGVSLAERSLRSLRGAGAGDVIAVTGHCPEGFEPIGRLLSERRFNSRFADAGNIYSLWCARDIVEGGCYIVNSDVLFEDEVARRLVALEGTAVLCSRSHGVDEESMKAVSRDGLLTRLSKEVPAEPHPEYIGLTRIDPDQGPALLSILEELVERGEVDAYYEAAIEELARSEPVLVVRVDGLAWIEIDDHEDLARARTEVLEHAS